MIETPPSPQLFTRRRLIRHVGVHLLAAPAVILASRRTGRADALDPLRPILCPEQECGYRYNPRLGDPEFGVPPGTLLEDLPADWSCPECGAELHLW